MSIKKWIKKFFCSQEKEEPEKEENPLPEGQTERIIVLVQRAITPLIESYLKKQSKISMWDIVLYWGKMILAATLILVCAVNHLIDQCTTGIILGTFLGYVLGHKNE